MAGGEGGGGRVGVGRTAGETPALQAWLFHHGGCAHPVCCVDVYIRLLRERESGHVALGRRHPQVQLCLCLLRLRPLRLLRRLLRVRCWCGCGCGCWCGCGGGCGCGCGCECGCELSGAAAAAVCWARVEHGVSQGGGEGASEQGAGWVRLLRRGFQLLRCLRGRWHASPGADSPPP